ncbi:MAG: anti-sigma factor, partial [Actinomycetes bacterium]
MRHTDPEVLALRALGAPDGDPADDSHLLACPRCQSDLDQLRAVVAAARSATPDDRPTDPPPQVWE